MTTDRTPITDRLYGHRRAYAAWNGWRWTGWYLRRRKIGAAIRQAWGAYVSGDDGERCQLCGRSYLPWHADDGLYGLVTGRWPKADGEGASGLFCPDCFSRMADQIGTSLIWRPEAQ